MTDNPDLHCGRGWLARASDVLTGAEDYLSAVEYARTAAIIGSGYVALAHAERAARSSATLDAAAERVRRAAAEARPHDDEDGSVVYIVESSGEAVYAGDSDARARAWIKTADGSFTDLSVTALAVDRG